MAQKIFELNQIAELISNEIRAVQPEFNPSDPNNWLYGLVQGLASVANNQNYKLLNAQDQAFWQTASGINLDRSGVDRDVIRYTESASSGDIAIEGVASTLVPSGTFYSSGSVTLETQDDATIVDNIYFIDSISESSGVATAVTSSDHEIPTGGTIIVSGFDQTEYNITATATVLSSDSFSFNVTGSPPPGTGSGQASWTGVNASTVSQDVGSSQNLLSGSTVTISASIPGVDDTAFVSRLGITGGRDLESDDEYRDRIGDKAINPSAGTAPSNIKRWLSENYPKTTWSEVKRATPSAGAFEVYLIYGNEDNISPSASELDAIKDQMLEDLVGATTHEDNVYILTPTLIPVTFELSSISPNTSKMQQAIGKNLEAFFLDNVFFETTMTEEAYKLAIQSTVDEDGNPLQSYTLVTPSGSIIASTGELISFGGVTFS